jgi:hypothetical protein
VLARDNEGLGDIARAYRVDLPKLAVLNEGHILTVRTDGKLYPGTGVRLPESCLFPTAAASAAAAATTTTTTTTSSWQFTMSQQQRQDLCTALIASGCPESSVMSSPLDWESIAVMLQRFTAMNAGSRAEMRRRFEGFLNEPLRADAAPQRRAMQHLLAHVRLFSLPASSSSSSSRLSSSSSSSSSASFSSSSSASSNGMVARRRTRPSAPLPRFTLESTEPTTLAHAIQYFKALKQRFASDPDSYGVFLDILHSYERDRSRPLEQRRGLPEVVRRVSTLLAPHQDLLMGFVTFVPHRLQPQAREVFREVFREEAQKAHATRRPNENMLKPTDAANNGVVSSMVPTPLAMGSVGGSAGGDGGTQGGMMGGDESRLDEALDFIKLVR